MISRHLHHSVKTLRNFGPYFLVELLLPGGTLVALLLWLSRRFVRDGLRGTRQHQFPPMTAKPVVIAKPEPGHKDLCMCAAHTVAWTGPLHRFRQWCESTRVPAQCCA